MSRADDLRALLAMVNDAKASSWELDQRLFALGWGWSFPLHGASLCEFKRIRREGLGNFSSSVDAAYNLIDRLLPGWAWAVAVSNGRFRASLTAPNPLRPMPVIARDCATGGLVLCAALLSALIAQEAENGR
jgi:hypothetical protein